MWFPRRCKILLRSAVDNHFWDNSNITKKNIFFFFSSFINLFIIEKHQAKAERLAAGCYFPRGSVHWIHRKSGVPHKRFCTSICWVFRKIDTVRTFAQISGSTITIEQLKSFFTLNPMPSILDSASFSLTVEVGVWHQMIILVYFYFSLKLSSSTEKVVD